MMQEKISRIIGEYSTGEKGPMLFVTAGIHGNEPSGVLALQEVFKQLHKTKPAIKGTILGVAGNKEALHRNQRYIDEDLNRTWTEENLEKANIESHEEQEMYEIIEVLEKYNKQGFKKRYFIDCHTTSSDSLPYMSVQDVNDNNDFAHQFPTYIVKGFSDIITGDIDHYLSRTGMTGFVFEAGQHTSKASAQNHEGMIWLALHKVCGLDLHTIETFPDCVEAFAEKNAPEQKTFEIEYRHGLTNNDAFKMQPGFQNFQEIKKGELLAMQNGEEVRSRWNARIFMPLYQAQGNDGFFVIKEVKY
ncbi:succinylglutamate desuccinylase/aspartoacylase family protein [Mesonia sp. K7]|uniref:succinylglutamate desuccinylase/aspartoacylase domain-containing protein n=1 Tax=Mesonia sp. K7 TaxID=2218606 RepID=UPI000DA81F66|nr:succinylglutamate desuccinylase/aspartoacylase family protein [Mesonia sp. K7]PZD77409.1 succinylglutamate desuccinylase [Mesonia sp. K7]